MVSQLQTQFSQQEEDIIKCIAVLSQKSVQSELDLYQALTQYINLISHNFGDDDDFLQINFAKAALLLESSTKAYGTKIQHLDLTSHDVWEALSNSTKKTRDRPAGDAEAAEDNDVDAVEQEGERHRRRRRRMRGDLAEDDFLEIDNLTGLAGKSQNEPKHSKSNLLFIEQAVNLLAKNKKERKRPVVTLNTIDDKDDSKLRDWVLTPDMMIVREISAAADSSDVSRCFDSEDSIADDNGSFSAEWALPDIGQESLLHNNSDPVEETERACPQVAQRLKEHIFSIGAEEMGIEKGPADKDSGEEPANFFNANKELTSKPLNPGNVKRNMCYACGAKRVHKKREKYCKKPRVSLDDFLNPLAQPTIRDLTHGVLTDEELYGMYKCQMKMLSKLRRSRDSTGMSPEKDDGNVDFAGFDADEIRNVDDNESDIGCSNDVANTIDLPLPDMDCLLPPTDDARDVFSTASREDDPLHISPEDAIERNKQLNIRTNAWHESIGDKIALSERRGALDMDRLASVIMNNFTDNEKKLTFQELVRGQGRKDVPRYFLTCLQLTNEGNINIEKNGARFATDCMTVVRLRKKRVREELEGYVPDGLSVSKRSRESNVEDSSISLQYSSESDSERVDRRPKEKKIKRIANAVQSRGGKTRKR